MDIVSVDPVDWVGSHPQKFFPTGKVEPIGLLAYLMADVIELGGGTCSMVRDGEWWLVGSDFDWLQHDRYSASELFRHVVPAPGHGEHSMRGEILLATFARNVSVSLGRDLLRVKGNAPPQKTVDRAKEFRRAIVFSM
ncbi:hypothetical protein [Roseateles sp. L2-2]|uniref:hypothetical protein n=1 Tax=Roseateles sp. L2-2 TaxID=3422597 RepID=UPI003D36A11B